MSIEYICPDCQETYMDEEIPEDEVCTECGSKLEFFECY